MEKFAGRCETCRFWVPSGEHLNGVRQGDGVMGHCHRYPPQLPDRNLAPSDKVEPWNEFPHTHSDDWCGEWQALPEPPPSSPTGS